MLHVLSVEEALGGETSGDVGIQAAAEAPLASAATFRSGARLLSPRGCVLRAPAAYRAYTRKNGGVSELLLDTLPEPPAAWCVLPNHYHVLVRCTDVKNTCRTLGKLHGSTSFRWNGDENTRGRKVWHSLTDRAMRNGDHFWSTVNYIHHNPVKHGYADRWENWPFSSAADYLEEMGRDAAAEIWKRFPVLDYGKDWDD